MRAYVYVVALSGEWRAQYSIDMEIDQRYWLDGDFQEAVFAGSGRGLQPSADRMVLWPCALPLGDAIAVVEMWETAKDRRLLPLSESDAAEWLTRCCVMEAGDRSGKGGAAARRPVMLARAAQEERSALQRAECRAQAMELAAAAEQAATALQGRALLGSEAHALLAAAGAARPGAASWSDVLQLAALLGRLRLRSAVAAERRRWALLRPRRHCRCLRCGSGEARMRRTPCAACGCVCAYCEA